MRVAHYLRPLVVALAIYFTHATQIMQRPADYANKTQSHPPFRQYKSGNDSQPIGQRVSRTETGRFNVGYFTNWGIYGRGFYPQHLDVSSLTHVLYAFADVSPDSGAVELSDTWSDQEKRYDGDPPDDHGNNLYGNFKQLYLLKKANRSLNVLLSIGGWSYSQAGHFDFVMDEQKRATFVSSALQILEDNGLDGFDLDFEYPTAGTQAQAFSSLLLELRTALNDLAAKKGDKTPYQLSAAVPAGANSYEGLPINEMDPSLSFWNLMAYDYAGPWSSVADHQANLFGPSFNNASTDLAVKWYIDNGACPGKINIGMPLYGRSFDRTTGIGEPFEEGSGSWEAETYDYNALPFTGATVTENSTVGASYSYDSTKRVLITYDTPNIAATKAQYIVDNKLGGAMFWDLSGDKTGPESLVRTAAAVFGSLDDTENHLNYPGSRFENIRNGLAEDQPASPTPPADSTPVGDDLSNYPSDISQPAVQQSVSSTWHNSTSLSALSAPTVSLTHSTGPSIPSNSCAPISDLSSVSRALSSSTQPSFVSTSTTNSVTVSTASPTFLPPSSPSPRNSSSTGSSFSSGTPAFSSIPLRASTDSSISNVSPTSPGSPLVSTSPTNSSASAAAGTLSGQRVGHKRLHSRCFRSSNNGC